jgi:hypothetical protein
VETAAAVATTSTIIFMEVPFLERCNNYKLGGTRKVPPGMAGGAGTIDRGWDLAGR